MKIAIIIPTRSRIKSLDRGINTAFNMASDPKNVAVFLMYDSDDQETKRFIENKTKENPDWNIYSKEVYIDDEIVKKGINIHDRYFNPGARWAVELGYKYIWPTGNDVEYCTKNYDLIIENKVEKFLSDKPDRVVYVAVDADNDAMRAKVDFCPFHIFTKEVVETWGYVQINEITSWGADSACYQIMKQVAGGSRLLAVPEVSIKHWSYHTGRKHGEQEVDDGSGANGDSISYRLSTKVMHLTAKQHLWYVRQLEDRIRKYSIV
jgi:hypothetical protein